MLANYSPTTGTLGVESFLHVLKIPAIISEWAALFPLVSHLANYGDDCHMVGELALAGHLTVGLFPKLGYLGGISRLLQGGPDFFDRANAKGEASQKIWDVNWGSVFTPANGTAMHILTKYALRKQQEPMEMPDEVLAEPSHLPGIATAAAPASLQQPMLHSKAYFRRHQDLHVIRMSRTNHTRPIRGTILTLIVSHFGWIAYHFILIGVTVFLVLLGAFGSAAVVFNGLASKFVCRLLRAERPSRFLESNENHDACMLSAVHENATTWSLYIGDRGVIDWLLNKTMLKSPPAGRIQTAFFRLAHIAQLLAMTFVAAQKGVDGVCLVILLIVNYGFQYLFEGHKLARQWLEAENVSVDAHSFRFSGRTPMIGAIHTISQARDAEWMKSLIVPCPRIKVWLDELKCSAEMRTQVDLDMQILSSSDRSWVLLNSQLAIQAARLIREKLNQGKAPESLYVKSCT